MHPTLLDHIALWVADRDALADRLCAELDMHVVDRTDRYTLVGPDARAGKLTLFVPESDDQPSAGDLVAIVLASDEPHAPIVTEDGLTITFAPHATAPRHSVIGLTLASSDPTIAAADWESHFGLRVRTAHRDVATLEIGGTSGADPQTLTLVREQVAASATPMLNHLGLLVASADEHVSEARELGLDIVKQVETDNTSAVFVLGPGQVTVEYIEHKPAFSLT